MLTYPVIPLAGYGIEHAQCVPPSEFSEPSFITESYQTLHPISSEELLSLKYESDYPTVILRDPVQTDSLQTDYFTIKQEVVTADNMCMGRTSRGKDASLQSLCLDFQCISPLAPIDTNGWWHCPFHPGGFFLFGAKKTHLCLTNSLPNTSRPRVRNLLCIMSQMLNSCVSFFSTDWCNSSLHKLSIWPNELRLTAPWRAV